MGVAASKRLYLQTQGCQFPASSPAAWWFRSPGGEPAVINAGRQHQEVHFSCSFEETRG